MRMVDDHSMALRKQGYATRLKGFNRRGYERVRILPYNECCRGFVGVDALDDPR